MRVAFFNYLPLEYGGGTARYFIDVSTGLQQRYKQLAVSVITFDSAFAKKIITLYSLYFFNKYDTEVHNKENMPQIKKRLKNVEYYQAESIHDLQVKLASFDRIYCKNDFVEAFLLRYLVKISDQKKVIFGFHTPIIYEHPNSMHAKMHNLLYVSRLYTSLIKDNYKLHVLNSFDQKLLAQLLPQSHVEKIYNPFDFDFFENSSRLSKRQRKKDKIIRLLWIARLTEQKGVDDLLSLIDVVNKSHYSDMVVWNIVGDGELKSKVIKSAKKWKNIYYHGYIQYDSLANIYEQSDLFISTSKWESFPYTLLEAQAFGLPVICYNIHGCDEIIRHKINGFLVDTFEAFEKQLIQYILNQGLSKNIIKRYIRKKFSQESIYKQLYLLLQ